MNWIRNWLGRRRKLAERLAKLEAELDAERERRLAEERAERAELELGFLPGTTEEKIEVLKLLDAMPEATRKAASAMFEKTNKVAGLAFETLGSRGCRLLGGNDEGYKLASGFDDRIAEIRKTTRRGFRAEALREARLAYPEEFHSWAWRG